EDLKGRERIGEPPKRELLDAAHRAPRAAPDRFRRHAAGRSPSAGDGETTGDGNIGRNSDWSRMMFAREIRAWIAMSAANPRTAAARMTASGASKRRSTTATIAPTSTALSTVTRNGVDAAMNCQVPTFDGTTWVTYMPRGSSCGLMTKYGARSGAISR